MIKKILLASVLSGCHLYAGSDRGDTQTPSCDIEVSRASGWVNVDVSASCVGDWYLEHRVISDGAITVSRVGRPCDELTSTSILATPGIQTMRATGALVSDAQKKRIECTVADHTVTVAE